jgi:hypothetical protein
MMVEGTGLSAGGGYFVFARCPLPTMEGLLAAELSDTASRANEVRQMSCSRQTSRMVSPPFAFRRDADSFCYGVAFAFHFLGPFHKVPDHHSRWISLTGPNQIASGRVIGPSAVIDY